MLVSIYFKAKTESFGIFGDFIIRQRCLEMDFYFVEKMLMNRFL